MWTRQELKAKAKTTFKRNYWKTVLVALILLFTTGGNVAARVSDRWDATHQEPMVTYEDDLPVVAEDLPESVGEVAERLQHEGSAPATADEGSVEALDTPVVGGVVLALVGAVGTVLLVVVTAVSAFLLNPLHVGARRFFSRNLNRQADVREVFWAFDHNYLEIVKTMFLRDIFTVLWMLLLVVPGFVKLYEYRMIPYLLAEDPTMTKDRAFAESRRLMSGQKWKTFVMDLSFVGWGLLSVVTLGAVAVFYAMPYKDMTDAALYEALTYGGTTTAPGLGEPADTPAMDVPVVPFAAEGAAAPSWDDEADPEA